MLPEHPFWVIERNAYVAARELKPGTHALGVLGEQGEIGQGAAGNPETVYNFEVPTYHNYFAYGYLVHNESEQHQARMGGDASININQQFSDGGLAMRQTAQIMQNVMKAAGRQAMLRASIGS